MGRPAEATVAARAARRTVGPEGLEAVLLPLLQDLPRLVVVGVRSVVRDGLARDLANDLEDAAVRAVIADAGICPSSGSVAWPDGLGLPLSLAAAPAVRHLAGIPTVP
jgi:hypothetical protein